VVSREDISFPPGGVDAVVVGLRMMNVAHRHF
jgi:hypothetical protein